MGTKIISPKEKKVVLQNFFSLSSLQGISYILPVAIIPYLIRVIGPGKFGLIAFAQAFVQYFMILTDYGFSLSATRKISLCEADKEKVCHIFSSVMTVKTFLAVASLGIMLVIINSVPRFKGDWLVFVLSFGAVIGNTLFPAWFFQGKEKMHYTAAINIIGGVIYALCIFIFVKKPADYLYVPALNSLYFIITGIFGLYTAFKEFELEFIFQTYEGIQEELKTGWNIFSSIIAVNAYTATRVFAVGLLTNNTITGLYSIGEKVASLIQLFPLDSFSQAIYPRLSKIFAVDKVRALKLMYKVQKTTTMLFLAVLPVIYISAPWIVKIVCGRPYDEVIITLRLMLLAVFFIGANAFKIQFLLVCGRSNTYTKIHVAAALVGLPLIFILIWMFSYIGAAIASVIIEVAIYILTMRMVKDVRKNLINA